jgi:hypothetical protein
VVPQHKLVVADFHSRIHIQRSKHIKVLRMKWWKFKKESTHTFKKRVFL